MSGGKNRSKPQPLTNSKPISQTTSVTPNSSTTKHGASKLPLPSTQSKLTKGPSSTVPVSTDNSLPSHPSYNLLAQHHPADQALEIYTQKIQHKPLLLQPTSVTNPDKRALRRHIRLRKKEYYLRKRKPRPLSAKEKRELGVYDLRNQEVKYEIYRGLNRLWEGYVLEVLGLTDSSSHAMIQTSSKGGCSNGGNRSNSKANGGAGAKRKSTVELKDGQEPKQIRLNPQAHGSLLASADYHGADIEVVRSCDVGKVGIRGIVVRETKYTFVVVTPKDQVRTIHKKGTIFRFCVRLGPPQEQQKEQQKEKEIDDLKVGHDDKKSAEVNVDDDSAAMNTKSHQSTRKLVFEVHGSQFEVRPAERAS